MPSIVLDKSDITSVRNSLTAIKAGVPDAIRFATNDSLVSLKTDSAREVGERITAAITRIKKTFTVSKMLKSRPSADITCAGEPLELSYFKVSKTMKGLKAQVFKPGSPSLIRHSFLVTFKSGHKSAVWREEKDIKGQRPKRFPVGKYAKKPPSPRKRTLGEIKTGVTTFQLPLKILYGPRVPDIFGDDKIMDKVLAKASGYYDNRLNYHTDRLLDKARSA